VAIPLESEFTEKKSFSKYRQTKWIAVALFGVVVLALTVFNFTVGSGTLTLGRISNIIIPSVYVTSLYIAWKKFLSSNAETVVIDEAENGFNITNLGKTTVSLREIAYVEIRKVKGGYTIAKKFRKLNEILEPGEHHNFTLTTGTEMAAVTDLCYFNYNGEQVFIEPENFYYNATELVDKNYGYFHQLIQFYVEDPPNPRPADKEIKLPFLDIMEKTPAEILSQKVGKDYEKTEEEAIVITPKSGAMLLE